MKKLLLIPLLFLGCASNYANIDKKIEETNKERKLIQKYQISKSALTKVKNGYIFTLPEGNGFSIYKIDENYDLVAKKQIPFLFDIKKTKYKNSKIYIVGYDQKKDKPALFIIDENLKNYTIKDFANKYDLPKDFIIDKNPVVLLSTYKNQNADIELYANGKTTIFPNPDQEHGSFIIKKDGGYYIIGSIQHPQEDLLILFVKDGKIVWSKVYDFGMEDLPTKVEIKDNNIVIEVLSQDYMGAEHQFFITIDSNGKIIKIKKGIEFKTLPTRYRT
jgi:hypothetical protein